MIDFANESLREGLERVEAEYKAALKKADDGCPHDDADLLLFQLRASARIRAREIRDARVAELLGAADKGTEA